MKIRPIKQNNAQSFRGYKNIMADRVITPPTAFTYLSMKLNNVGAKDLDTWHMIQRKLYNISNVKDIIAIKLLEKEKNMPIVVLEKPLALEDKNGRSKDEPTLIKTYSFLASLTKRISNDNKLIQDDEMFDTFNFLHNDFTQKVFRNPSLSFLFLKLGLRSKKEQPQPIAAYINKSITDIMVDYFK